jgi:zinc and cadmium transporter
MNGSTTAPILALALYCVLLFFASLAGGGFPLLLGRTHARIQVTVSFVAGLMLGMALLHFIPHAESQLHSLDATMTWVLAGFLVMFFLQRFFHYHHHDLPAHDDEAAASPAAEAATHNHEHDHEAAPPAGKNLGPLAWVGTAIGLTLHSLLDGLALATAVAVESRGHSRFVGFGTALAVILHKPFDAMAISTVMARSGCSRRSLQLLNTLFALTAPVGVVLFYLGASQVAGADSAFVGRALAFCAGTFLCVACSDLLPELQFHSHDRFKLSLALLAGLGIAFLVGLFETGGHDHPGSAAAPGPGPASVVAPAACPSSSLVARRQA